MPKPLLFITGFLGAGKTTLLRALLDEFNQLDQTVDVILNDFENAEIDAATLPETGTSIFPLAASCACCDSLDDLVKLCLAAQESKGDALLIELNGTADPLPLLETFTLLEEKMPFSPRWQVAVVDARHWRKRLQFDALEIRQIETATHWLLSHREGLNDSEISEVVQSVEKTNRFAARIDSLQLAADLNSSAPLLSPSTDIPPSTNRECENNQGHDHTHDHEHGLSHRFTGCQIPLPGRFHKSQSVQFLESLPEEVVRAKALVKLRESPGYRWLFERTGRQPILEPIRVEMNSRAAPTSLVCIGPGIDPSALQHLVMKAFGA